MTGVTFTTKGALRKSALRQANERLALDAIRQNPAISRSDLARITGLSPSSVSFIVNRLLRAGLLREEKAENHSQVGRRPTSLYLVREAMLAIGVEISQHESRIALADVNGQVLRQKSIPWHVNHEILGQRIHAALRSLVEEAAAQKVLGIGVALPGTIDRNIGRVIAAENLNWLNVDLDGLIRGRIALPFYYENSAKLSALAERWFSEPGQRTLRDFVFITPTNGLGTGIITNGHLLQGSSAIGGEFGHVMLYPDGRRCSCGNQGCWEQYAGDVALLRVYAENGGAPVAGEQLDAAEVVRRARRGEEAARNTLRQVARDLGLGFVNLVMVFNPEALVVGGYIADAWDLIEDIVWQALRSRAPHYALAGLRVFPSNHPADSSLLGAVALVYSHYFTRFDHGGDGAQSASVLMHASV
jgi:predicted NBD/HSP70 family sugar kinase